MTIPIFSGKRILLGVTGSIACYKAAGLASSLRQAGAQVDVLLSSSASHFVSPLTFQSVTGRKVFMDEDLWGAEGHVVHVGLAEGADLFVIAPCTADTMARLAMGRGDGIISLTALAARSPLLLAPAMDGGMWDHPATQANAATLQERGATLLGPAEGHLASGQLGVGRMLEPDELFDYIRLALAEGGPLSGRKVVVTAGGTQEPLDPVRTLTNRSSGKQGYALARAALDHGAQVTLVSTPAGIQTPTGADLVPVETAAEMLGAVLEAVADADILLMAAAVADFRPIDPADNKIKRRQGTPEILLEPTEDILEAVARQKTGTGCPRVSIGFAAESRDLLENAAMKLESKSLDLIAANDITAPGAGFSVDTNEVTLLFAGGRSEELPQMSKAEVAERIIKEAISLLKTSS
ncbi:MAG: bifunctional phosphopantothenoylcysteine decarboxylase/phosphopantothenate--cysteine ligase CoaBC [Anaerolineales bacterium]|nr:bifunctional phosphopantothenoylcysteine decarboxylase/phosphopantothenate--cysteine ligase CoaBC [Anaerolineales bacterium]